ncbi:uncharacterized protein LOC109842887 isoform X2 [Asparagus officinalis]|uniref:uncharacterized protein LOC109842887 isoform X2 n=1 Tax=Asparagus officinalis TaxID=4686 RepID=UPI00098E6ACC|nr:uncharacterized protein LOC109842887 isoform X2 [Asparagus officinalis]
MVPRNPGSSRSHDRVESHQGDDPDYVLFLNHLSPDRSGASYTLRISNNVIGYEDQDRGGSSFDRNNTNNKNDGDCGSSKDVSGPDDASTDVLGGEVLSSFQSRLMESLKRPFDQREYDRLLAEAKKRKPIVKFKHLRTEDIPYETDELGASYFHHYPDLRRKVKSADHVGGLMLLRGFFFWLQNLGHKGAYKPWESNL